MSDKKLRKITKADIKRSKEYPPEDTSRKAKVVKIHDGDTCDLVVERKRSGRLERFKCRLAEIDTPEIDSDQPKEIKKAKKARDFLAWLCMGNDPADFSRRSKPWSDDELQGQLDENTTLIYAEFRKADRYGRPLVVLREDKEAKESFNDLLVKHDYADVYGE